VLKGVVDFELVLKLLSTHDKQDARERRDAMNIDKDTALLEARDLSVRFGKICALDGLDLVVPSGQVLAILGPNGAGKTTFVRTLSTLVRPTSGVLLVR
jgi:ABC-type transporter Mla maintaining outer membrane lipid asymmetry ATPase subunit MlaF